MNDLAVFHKCAKFEILFELTVPRNLLIKTPKNYIILESASCRFSRDNRAISSPKLSILSCKIMVHFLRNNSLDFSLIG